MNGSSCQIKAKDRGGRAEVFQGIAGWRLTALYITA